MPRRRLPPWKAWYHCLFVFQCSSSSPDPWQPGYEHQSNIPHSERRIKFGPSNQYFIRNLTDFFRILRFNRSLCSEWIISPLGSRSPMLNSTRRRSSYKRQVDRYVDGFRRNDRSGNLLYLCSQLLNEATSMCAEIGKLAQKALEERASALRGRCEHNPTTKAGPRGNDWSQTELRLCCILY